MLPIVKRLRPDPRLETARNDVRTVQQTARNQVLLRLETMRERATERRCRRGCPTRHRAGRILNHAQTKVRWDRSCRSNAKGTYRKVILRLFTPPNCAPNRRAVPTAIRSGVSEPTSATPKIPKSRRPCLEVGSALPADLSSSHHSRRDPRPLSGPISPSTGSGR
jgi:hypothetical protein